MRHPAPGKLAPDQTPSRRPLVDAQRALAGRGRFQQTTNDERRCRVTLAGRDRVAQPSRRRSAATSAHQIRRRERLVSAALPLAPASTHQRPAARPRKAPTPPSPNSRRRTRRSPRPPQARVAQRSHPSLAARYRTAAFASPDLPASPSLRAALVHDGPPGSARSRHGEPLLISIAHFQRQRPGQLQRWLRPAFPTQLA
jgi:hypothetical protein